MYYSPPRVNAKCIILLIYKTNSSFLVYNLITTNFECHRTFSGIYVDKSKGWHCDGGKSGQKVDKVEKTKAKENEIRKITGAGPLEF